VAAPAVTVARTTKAGRVPEQIVADEIDFMDPDWLRALKELHITFDPVPA
jgi:hypothetical protein